MLTQAEAVELISELVSATTDVVKAVNSRATLNVVKSRDARERKAATRLFISLTGESPDPHTLNLLVNE